MKRKYSKKIYGSFLLLLKKLFGADAAKKFDVKFRFHKTINLKNPQTLPEKIIFLENHYPDDLVSRCTDKWEVRSFVEEKGLAKILVPSCGGPWQSANDVQFDLLPNKFVLKATHGSKMNFFCKDKTTFDKEACKNTISEWLKTRYGAYSAEWHYLKIKPRIYGEIYLNDADKMVDYKIHCLNGKPAFILVFSDRDSTSHAGMSVKLDLYDLNWKNLNQYVCGSGLETAGNGDFPKPQNLQELLDISSILSKDFPFARVDLYDIDGHIFFGEITFTPAGGLLPFLSDEWNAEMGKLLVLPGTQHENPNFDQHIQ